MMLILFGLLQALLPLILTTAFMHLIGVSIYAGAIPWIAIAWAAIGVTVILQRQRIINWSKKSKMQTLAKKIK